MGISTSNLHYIQTLDIPTKPMMTITTTKQPIHQLQPLNSKVPDTFSMDLFCQRASRPIHSSPPAQRAVGGEISIFENHSESALKGYWTGFWATECPLTATKPIKICRGSSGKVLGSSPRPFYDEFLRISGDLEPVSGIRGQ